MAKRRLKLAKRVICACGLASDTLGEVTIDDKVALVQPHPESTLYLCPLASNLHPSYQQAWFFSDCIAYEHDIPTIVYPMASELRRFGYRFVHYGPTKPRKVHVVSVGKMGNTNDDVKTHAKRPLGAELTTRAFYLPTLIRILEEIRELRHGPLTFVLFRHYDNHDRIDLPFTKKYGPVAQEIHLYATALRQADALSEYLAYYHRFSR